MDPLVFGAVLAAALLHAGWNALIKMQLDRLSSVLLMAIAHGLLAVLLLPLFPIPAAAAWPWLIASSLLHTGYKIFLIRAYDHGDLSQVYPLARGTAPLLVVLVSTVLLDEALPLTKIIAVLAIALGVVAMSLEKSASLRSIPAQGVFYAICTASFTASYTLVDGIGARLAETAAGFTLWMFAGDTLCIVIYGLFVRGPNGFRRLRSSWQGGLLAGAMSLGSYWVAIWAFTVAPIALVAALRETSVLFAMLIAVVFLREKTGPQRWGAAALIASGVVLMRF